MKNFNRQIGMILVSLTCFVLEVGAQVPVDTSIVKKEYISIEEALKQPEKVYRLNLSNQNFKMPSDSVWALFQNLEYLNLKNDHLVNIPKGFGNLKKLKVLDLSGNDFKLLPESLSELENLEEIFLNDEKYMDLENSLLIIKNLPKLKILHLERDNLQEIPRNLIYLYNLEKLYLNDNSFKTVPTEVKELKHLNYIDLSNNKYRLNNPNLQEQGFGIKVRL